MMIWWKKKNKMWLRDLLSLFSVKCVGCVEKAFSNLARSCTVFNNFFSPFIRTHNSQLHLHTFHSFFSFGEAREGGAITNNQSNESGECCDGENVKIQFGYCVCIESTIFLSIHVKIFLFIPSQKKCRKKSHGNIRATEEWKAIEDFLLHICRLNVLKNVCKFLKRKSKVRKNWGKSMLGISFIVKLFGKAKFYPQNVSLLSHLFPALFMHLLKKKAVDEISCRRKKKKNFNQHLFIHFPFSFIRYSIIHA